MCSGGNKIWVKEEAFCIDNNTMVDVEAAQKHYIEFAIFSAFVSFLCVFGNLTILYTFIRKKKIRYFGNYFLMSLSVTDLLTGYNVAGMCDPSFTCAQNVQCYQISFLRKNSPFFCRKNSFETRIWLDIS